MVIVRISPGLANQMYEFAAAYALSKELGRELVVDISSCYVSAWGYLLDYFNIPPCKKLICVQNGTTEYAHTNPERLPPRMKEEVEVWVEDRKGYVRYEGLDKLQNMDKPDTIYLCGYFFDRKRYFKKYWEEIRHNFTLKQKFREVEKFKELINGKTSVGVHIRRGDMLLADFATAMKDDYYRAAIEYCRKRYKDCIFCIFSDDIEFAKDLLGQDSTVYYVHFWGYDDAALLEFMCLSLCNHRILSNSSTFSRLADELNTNEDGHFFVQATASGWKELKNHLIREKNERLLEVKQNRRIIIDKYDIKKYAKKYVTDSIPNISDCDKRIEKIISAEITEDNAEFLLDEIAELSLNIYECNSSLEPAILLKKFIALVLCKEFHMALQASVKLYEKYRENAEFKKYLVIALDAIGAKKEAAIESVSHTGEHSKKHFIIVPGIKMQPSDYLVGLAELGVALYHMGHDVSLVFAPFDESESYYLQKNEYLVNRNGANMGCRQYDLEEVKRRGIASFYQSFEEDELVVISRDPDFYDKQFEHIMYVFPDYSDIRDIETTNAINISSDVIKQLYDKADIVLTKDRDKADMPKAAFWEDDGCKDEYWTSEGMWELGYEHRLSERVMDMAAALVDELRKPCIV